MMLASYYSIMFSGCQQPEKLSKKTLHEEHGSNTFGMR